MVVKDGKSTGTEEHFRSFEDADHFFSRQGRTKSCDLKEASGPRALAWNNEGTLLAAGCDNKLVYVGKLDESRLRSYLMGFGHDAFVSDVRWSHADGRLLASSSTDETLRVWDMRSNVCAQSANTKHCSHERVMWTPDDRQIVAVSKNASNQSVLTAWDRRLGAPTESSEFKEEIFEAAFHPNGKYVFCAMGGGKVGIFEWPSLKRYRTLRAHPPLSECLSVVLSPDGRKMAVGGSDACVSVWNVDELTCTSMITRPDYPVATLSFSQCSNLLAWGGEDRCIEVSWVDRNRNIIDIPASSRTMSVAWNPRLYLLAFANAPTDHREPITLRLFGSSGDSRRA
ncbi:hypothetical protein M3Y99_00702800 [Aphelenchoides fujianensis]|nr:hypothetical protein M3Y99_00702800 [Aphelenchoides fujianensis]